MRRSRDLSELGILDLTGIITHGVVRNLGTYEQAKKILESVGLGDLISNPDSGRAIKTLPYFKFNFIKAPANILDELEELIVPIQHQDYQKVEGMLETLQFGGWNEQDEEFTTYVALSYFNDSKTYEIGVGEI